MEHEAVGQETIDPTVKGILMAVTAVSIFSVQDVIIRTLSGDYSVLEIMFIRAVVALGPMALFVYWSGGFATLRTPHLGLQFIRGALQMLSYVTYYLALAAMPLADATAMFFISPLVVTLLSVIFLGESVGLRRVIAVVVGFVGVLVIARPGSGTFGYAAILPLAAAVTYASSVIITRRLGPTHSGASMAFYAMIVFLIGSSISGFIFADGSFANETDPSLGFLLRGWQIPVADDLMLLVLLGCIAACGFYCLTQAYRVADASAVAPFEYIAMPIAVVWGIVMWDEFPEMITIFGIALVIGSGLYILHRETIRGRKVVTGRRIRL